MFTKLNIKKLVVLSQVVWFSVITIQAQEALERRIQLTIEEQSIQFILDSIETAADINFAYDRRKLPMNKITSIASTSETVAAILDHLFGQSGIEYAASVDQISLFRVRWPTYTLFGQIKDGATGEALIGANVFETVKYQGASSDADGYYSLTLREGQYILYSTYIGYQDRVDTIKLYEDKYLDLAMQPGAELEQVVVIDKLVKQEAIAALRRTSQGEEIIDVSHAKSLPISLGESDPMGIVRLLPGFVAGGSARQNTYVRGGNADQNLVLLDGVPLYHVNHGAGNLSIFNGAAVNEVRTFTNNIPALYGDRLSSVIDVTMREGNNQAFHGGAMLGFTSGSAYLEGPIIKNKSSFLVAARRSSSDILFGAFNIANTIISFYDINAKINYSLTNKDRLHATFYRGNDDQKFEANRFFGVESSDVKQRTRWGNTAATIRWNRKINPRLFSNFSAQITNFRHSNRDEIFQVDTATSQLISEFQYSSLVREGRLIADAVYVPSVKHQINFGGQFTWRVTDPGSVSSFDIVGNDTLIQEDELEKVNAQEAVLFVEEEFKLNEHWSFRGGLRFSYLSVEGKRYALPQLRSHIGYAFNDYNRLELSFDQTVQFMHLLSVAGSPVRNEKWLPTTRLTRPEKANQLSLNYIVSSEKWKMKIGGYFKSMTDLLFFNQQTSTFDSYTNWEEQTTVGTGEAYGVEFLLAKLNGKTNGWLSYAWSKSTLNFPELNGKEKFPHRYDRRHKINIALTHSIKPKPLKQRYFGVVWTFATGHWTTIPSAYEIDPVTLLRTPIFGKINNAQSPNFHQLSISFNKDRKTSRGNYVTWRYGIQNFYLRNNQDQPDFVFDTSSDQYLIRENTDLGAPTLFVSFAYAF